MRNSMMRAGVLLVALAGLLIALPALPDDAALKQDLHQTKEGIKDAGHAFGRAVKEGAHDFGKEVKKGVQEVKKGVHKGAKKVEQKTD